MRPDPSDNPSKIVAATLAKGFPLLRFPAPLESSYQDAVAPQRRQAIAAELLFCAPLYLILVWVDHEMVPDSMALALFLRLGLFLPLVAVAGLALFRMRSPLAREWLCGSLATIGCLVTVLISVSSRNPLNVHHLVILNAIVIYAVLFGRFWPMLAMCLSAFWFHIAALCLLGKLISDVGVGTTLLLMANITFMLYGCYLLERSSRKGFLIDRQEAEMDAELEQATNEIARIAREDALTGLANRRHFMEFLSEARERAVGDDHALALVLIDVDHFKAYNDLYGHPKGDDCLRAVGQALAQEVRASIDLAARWGGEEFAVVLTGADAASAAATAERLRDAVRAMAIAHGGSTTASVVTVSVGVAVTQPGRCLSASDLIAGADQALYRSKSSGRNRVSLMDPSSAQAPSPARAGDPVYAAQPEASA